VILIDGESGVGKSRLAKQMSAELGGVLVHLDDLYPGWNGLSAGREHAIDSVLIPLTEGRTGRYTAWDWARSVPGEVVEVAPTDVVIIEGCGISTEKSRRFANATVWVECEEGERRARLAQRDGDQFAEHLELWDAQVHAHMAANKPRETASVIVNSTSTMKTVGG
jgi:uridine kinase